MSPTSRCSGWAWPSTLSSTSSCQTPHLITLSLPICRVINFVFFERPPLNTTTRCRYAYYAFTVYMPAPRWLKKPITQARCSARRVCNLSRAPFLFHLQIQIIQFGSSLIIFMGTLFVIAGAAPRVGCFVLTRTHMYHLFVLREPCVGMSSLVFNVV